MQSPQIQILLLSASIFCLKPPGYTVTEGHYMVKFLITKLFNILHFPNDAIISTNTSVFATSVALTTVEVPD